RRGLTCFAGGRARLRLRAEEVALRAVVAPRRGRRAKTRRIEARMLAAAIKPEAPARDGEALFEQRREFAATAHARAERRIVIAATPHLLDEAHHVRRALRIVRV